MATTNSTEADIMNDQLEVMCCGLARTGTTTLYHTLKKLGYNAFHSLVDYFDNGHPNYVCDFWMKMVEANKNNCKNSVNWNDFFVTNNFNACADMPFPVFWKELSIYYPNCKFILTMRNENEWFKSCVNSVFNKNKYNIKHQLLTFIHYVLVNYIKHEYSLKLFQVFELNSEYYGSPSRWTLGDDKESCIKSFNKHNNDVINYFKHSERLFIINWDEIKGNKDKERQIFENLCTFLTIDYNTIDVNDRHFVVANKSNDMNTRNFKNNFQYIYKAVSQFLFDNNNNSIFIAIVIAFVFLVFAIFITLF